MNKKKLVIFLLFFITLASVLTYKLSNKEHVFSEKTETKIRLKTLNFKQALERNLKSQEASLIGPTPLITMERQYTEKEIENMNELQFSTLLSDVKRKLPKKSELKNIPAHALHTTPPIIIEAGKNLGLIKEVILIHPEFQKTAIPFYEECAKDNESPTTIRALCLTNLIIINKKTKLQNYPKEIVDLAKIVTEN